MTEQRDDPGSDRPARGVNPTAASLLGFLHEGPQSGWDLLATAQQRIGSFWNLTRSQVYRELAAMAAAGLVVAEEVGPRERRPYRITDAGRAAFRDWLAQPPGPEQIRYPLLLVLAFNQHLSSAEMTAFLVAHRAEHAARLAGYREEHRSAVAAGARPRDLVTLDFGTRYEEAVLAWFDALPEDLAGGPADASADRPAQAPGDG